MDAGPFPPVTTAPFAGTVMRMSADVTDHDAASGHDDQDQEHDLEHDLEHGDEHSHSHSHGSSHAFMVHRHRDVNGGTIRAAIFGVSDGLVSNVALILGVAAAASTRESVLVAGVAGLLAGSASMAAGEYVSMKAQAELVERELDIERQSIAKQPEMEARELAALYRRRGADAETARRMAQQVHQNPEVALDVHAREELGVNPDETGNAAAAALSSFIAFAFGAMIPLFPWFFSEGNGAVIASSVLGLVATAGVGAVLARFTERSMIRTAGRQMGWAIAACSVTWVIGSWLGTAVG
jgi:VIT1/CCC1 family predicted Fe2+/Mn2+ transporter